MLLVAAVFASGVISCMSAPHLVVPHVARQYHAQDELGQYAYGYSSSLSAKHEEKTLDGITRGGYSYVDGHGLVQSAAYVSDPVNGYRVAATNLPKGPAVPAGDEVVQVASPVSPIVIQGPPAPDFVQSLTPLVIPEGAKVIEGPAIVTPQIPSDASIVLEPIQEPNVEENITQDEPNEVLVAEENDENVKTEEAPAEEDIPPSNEPKEISSEEKEKTGVILTPEIAVVPPVSPLISKTVVSVPTGPVIAVVPSSVSVPLHIATQYHAQDELGQYVYGYAGGPSAKHEQKSFDGVTKGGYSYIDAHGLIQSAAYVSDPLGGFRIAATNIPRQVQPMYIPDSPEVEQAKQALFRAQAEHIAKL